MMGQAKPVAPKAGSTTAQFSDDKTGPENPNMFTGSSSQGKPEKITNPKELGLFANIKKLGKELFGMRKKSVVKPSFIAPTAATCVKTAIAKRGATMKSEMTDHGLKIMASLEARIACETAALDQTTADSQASANKLCIAADQKSKTDNETAFEKAKITAQTTYQAEVRQCLGGKGMTVPKSLDVNASN
jgi:hypothetical protein